MDEDCPCSQAETAIYTTLQLPVRPASLHDQWPLPCFLYICLTLFKALKQHFPVVRQITGFIAFPFTHLGSKTPYCWFLPGHCKGWGLPGAQEQWWLQLPRVSCQGPAARVHPTSPAREHGRIGDTRDSPEGTGGIPCPRHHTHPWGQAKATAHRWARPSLTWPGPRTGSGEVTVRSRPSGSWWFSQCHF